MAKFGICRASDELHISRVKFLFCRLKCENFGRAHKGEVFGIEKKYHILFAYELRERKAALYFAADDGVCLEVRRFFANEH